MKSLDLLDRACSTYDGNPEYALELFSQAMQCDDVKECKEIVKNLTLSDTDEDMEFLSEAAAKASRDMYVPKTIRRKRFI